MRRSGQDDDTNPHLLGIPKAPAQPRYALATIAAAASGTTAAFVCMRVQRSIGDTAVHATRTSIFLFAFPRTISRSSTCRRTSSSCHAAELQQHSEDIGAPDDDASPPSSTYDTPGISNQPHPEGEPSVMNIYAHSPDWSLWLRR